MATELRQLVFTFVMKLSFIFVRIKNHFCINGFAISLAVKQRLESSRKWPIHLSLVNSALLVLSQSSRINLRRYHGGLFSFDLDDRINRASVFQSIFCVLPLS